MNILIIDGQSGRLGAQVIEALREAELSENDRLYAVGTNAIATGAMLKAGADGGATGENSVRVMAKRADIIVGPIGIVLADSLMGEITPEMAVSVGQSDAVKVLLPVNKCQTIIIGTQQKTRVQLVEEAIRQIKALL